MSIYHRSLQVIAKTVKVQHSSDKAIILGICGLVFFFFQHQVSFSNFHEFSWFLQAAATISYGSFRIHTLLAHHRNPVGLQGDCSRLALHHMISDVFWSELMERGKHGTLLVEVRAMSSPTNLRQKLSYLAESSWELHVESIIVHSDF